MAKSNNDFRVTPPGAVKPAGPLLKALQNRLAQMAANPGTDSPDSPLMKLPADQMPTPASPPAEDLGMTIEEFLGDGGEAPDLAEASPVSVAQALQHMGLSETDATYWADWQERFGANKVAVDALYFLVHGGEDPDDPQYRIR